MFDRLEGIEKQHKNEKDTHRNNDAQSCHRSLLVFKFASPSGEVAWRKRHIDFHSLLHFFHQAPHIPAFNEHADGGDPHA